MPSEYVETSAAGAASATPDVAVVNVRFVTVADGVARALDTCATMVTRALAALDATEAAHTRQTGRIGVSTHWNQQRGAEQGFEATQSLSVRLTDTSAVGSVVTAMSEATGNAFRIDGLGWTFSDTESVHAQAREAAFRSARAKAEQLAALGGRTLGPLLRVREGAGSEISVGGPEMAVAASGTMSKVMMDMPVEPGRSDVETAVTCRWLLAD